MLRPYQHEARVQINTLLNAHRHPVYVAPTGTGKTKTAVQVITDRIRLGQRVFVLTPQDEIFQQWLIEFANNGIEYGFINQDGVRGRDKGVYVCMPLSLNNLLSVLPEKFKPDVIITDESHHSKAQTWENIYGYYNNATRLGLTATPQRTDGKGLDSLYTDIVQTITMKEAIDNSFLAEPLTVVPEQYKLECRIQNGDYDVHQQAEQLGKTRIIGNIIDQYSNIFNGLPVLVACSTYEHAEQMTQAFNDAGWNFGHIHSLLSSGDRKALLRKIRTGKINGLCTVGIGIEGMDIPGLYGLIWLRRTLSVTIYLQFIGRSLRPLPGKKYGIIIDPVGNVFIHGRPEMDRTWTLKGREDADREPDMLAPKMKLCPVCAVMNAEINRVCHICGYDFVEGGLTAGNKRKIPVMVDGNMVVLDGDDLARRRDQIREELEKQREAVKEQAGKENRQDPRKLSGREKVAVLKDGLGTRKGLFAEVIKEYL